VWNYSKTKKITLYADAVCSGYSDGSLDLFGGIAGWLGDGGVGGGYPNKSMRQVWSVLMMMCLYVGGRKYVSIRILPFSDVALDRLFSIRSFLVLFFFCTSICGFWTSILFWKRWSGGL
jgi:hypothetical protein